MSEEFDKGGSVTFQLQATSLSNNEAGWLARHDSQYKQAEILVVPSPDPEPQPCRVLGRQAQQGLACAREAQPRNRTPQPTPLQLSMRGLAMRLTAA